MMEQSSKASARVDRQSWEVPESERENARTLNPGFGIENSFASLLGRFVQAAWRRRFLVIVPVLILIPISIAAAFLLPRTYVARTLLVTQEGEGSFLGRDAGQASSLNQRVAGLEALLKSDQVLLPIVQAESPGDDLMRSRRRAEELRRELTIQLIGTDFLQVELKGSRQDGLGRKLRQIITRLFEVLLTENAPTATQIVLQNSLDELRAAERRQSTLEERAKEILPNGLPAAIERLNALQANRPTTTEGRASERPAELEAEGLKRLVEDYKTLEPEIDAARRQVAALQDGYKSNLARAGNLPATSGISVLNAPGRIKIIDSPADPLGATVSRLLYIAAGLLGSILIGIGLAWFAELVDTTVRYPEQLASATGVPVLATLPRSGASLPPAARAPPQQPRRRSRLLRSLILIALVIAVGYAVGIAIQLMPALAGLKRVIPWSF